MSTNQATGCIIVTPDQQVLVVGNISADIARAASFLVMAALSLQVITGVIVSPERRDDRFQPVSPVAATLSKA